MTYNDARRLADSLKSLQFCDELLVIDLGSKDNSLKIAKQFKAFVVHHKLVPDVDQIREYASALTKHDWIIFPDPDEVFPYDAVGEMNRFIKNNGKLGVIMLPWLFYFKAKPLKHTIWGVPNKFKGIVYHRRRVQFSGLVHHGIKASEGFETIKLEQIERNILKHYWMDTYKQLFEKHLRYIKLEGGARYKNGKRFSFGYLLRHTIKTLFNNLFVYRGIYGGWNGVFLSIFHSWYEFMSVLSLYSYQRAIKGNKRIA